MKAFFDQLSTNVLRYTVGMNCLLSTAALGVVWLTLLFGACFLCVHILKLAKLGREYQKERQLKAQTPPEPQKTAPPANEGEPVYYIVEKKRRSKSSFTEPKRIHFK